MMPARATRIRGGYWPPVTLKCSGRDQTPSDSGTHSFSSGGQTSGITRSGRMSCGCEPRNGAAALSRVLTSAPDMPASVRGDGRAGPGGRSGPRPLLVEDGVADGVQPSAGSVQRLADRVQLAPHAEAFHEAHRRVVREEAVRRDP